ncbi:type I polyketide synthase [Streptomyces sp. NPDC048581]|uniref:type I polyketide synthase n=1 Tax=Streptomyces sp. NPDC048581 TaxID=3365572 RepID=UPI00371558E4
MTDSPTVAARPASAPDAARIVARLRERIEKLERTRSEPIALIGIGCRLPGGVRSMEDYWDLLSGGVDAITPIPASRWDGDSYYDPDPETPGRMRMRYGAFVDGVDEFDPYFFGISPREASRMDPQQRLFLEVAWEALDRAGLSRETLAGTSTGVFVGVNSADYLQLQVADPSWADTYTITGGTNSLIANRLSYLLDLNGPSLTVDTACSSSLVAVHLACQSLRSGESDLAVVGGVNLILSPSVAVAHAKGMPLAPDGRCRTFDAAASGYTRGEGVLAVALRRLSDAVAAGDPVIAVINGTAVNQDGLSNGQTAPNGRAQQKVIRQALKSAALQPDRITLVEAHGTGTVLGDPIEVEALAATYGRADEAPPCLLGSVKTNIGHLESAAGLAGLVKAALCIKHGRIIGNLNFESLNPNIDLDGTRLALAEKAQDWTVPDHFRHAAVSSFGAGGTNAHAILGPAPAPEPAPEAAPAPPPPYVVAMSARTEELLAATAAAHRDFLHGAPDGDTEYRAIAHTATVRRTHQEHRLAVVARTAREAAERLGDWSESGFAAGVTGGRAADAPNGVVFAFSAHAQGGWAQTARRLSQESRAFRETLDDCDDALRPWLGRSIHDLIEGIDDERRIDLVQPVRYAITLGLAAWWTELGVSPQAVIGHGFGEVAAARFAGALDRVDGARVICAQSAAVEARRGHGGMLAVAASADRLADLVRRHDGLVVASSEGPLSAALSGPQDALEKAAAELKAENVPSRLVSQAVATHSSAMDAMREQLLDALSGLTPRPAGPQIVSTVTGQVREGTDFGPEHWFENMRRTVRFWDAAQTALGLGAGLFVDLSPGQPLASSLQRALADAEVEGLAVPAPNSGAAAGEPLLLGAAALHCAGMPIRFDTLLGSVAQAVPLVPQQWQHERLWYRERDTRAVAQAPKPAAPQRRRASADAELGGRLRTLPPAERVPAAADFVLGLVATALEFDPRELDPDAGFFQLGMDSLMATNVHKRIVAALGIPIPATVMFEHGSVNALARHLTEVASPEDEGQDGAVPEAVTVPAPEADARDVEALDLAEAEGLSEEDLIALLNAEIDSED